MNQKEIDDKCIDELLEEKFVVTKSKIDEIYSFGYYEGRIAGYEELNAKIRGLLYSENCGACSANAEYLNRIIKEPPATGGEERTK